MSGVATFRLVLLILVVMVWAYLAYRTFALCQARAEAEGNGLSTQIAQWFRAPEDRKDRNTFLFISFVLAAMLATRALGTGG